MKKLITLLLLTLSLNLMSQSFPAGYTVETVASGYNFPMSIDFYNNYMYVAERNGKIWLSSLQNGNWVRNNTPLLDLSSTGNNEIKPVGERGLQDIIVKHPFLYLSYNVNEEYLFGTGSPVGATIGRITRYEVIHSQNQAVAREVILGTTLEDGIPSLDYNHNSISLAFGDDGFMFIGVGDGSNNTFFNDAVNKGIIRPELNLNGRWLSQTLDIENGKILRIVPWTGEGVSSNPFHNWDNRKSTLSRLWAIGNRNPFRIFNDNNKLYIADVGSGKWEEITVVDKSGLNNGWGLREGFDVGSTGIGITNPDENQTYNNLMEQATSFEDDLNPQLRRFNHNVPELDYGHINVSPITRIPSFTNGQFVPIEYEENPIQGNSITGGVIIKEGFGDSYTGGYMFSDYTRGWLNIAMPSTDNSGRFFGEIINFCGIEFSQVVKIKQHSDGSIYIVQLNGLIKRISYDPSTLNVEEPEFNYIDAKKEYWSIEGKQLLNLDDVSNGIYIIKYSFENRIKIKKVLL